MLTLHPVVQELPRPRLDKPEETLYRRLAESPECAALADARIALALGSRKIAGLAPLAKAVVAVLRRFGAEVFLVPAMGSHGGGTAPAQRDVLASLGLTEREVGAVVVSREEVVLAGHTPRGLPVWVDAAAWEADGIVPLNRVKPHTAFRGPVESGPSKLLAVGLGKDHSAQALHRFGLAEGIPDSVAFLHAHGKIPFGVGVVENAWGETAELSVLFPETWIDEEAALLRRAWELYPRLPWDELDLLIVERMGKDVSGTGMDVNVIGMNRRFPQATQPPRIARVVALSLTPGAGGNATGVGYADVVTRRLAERMDAELTRHNCAISGFPEAALLPRVAETEEEAIRWALDSLPAPLAEANRVRAARIRDTSSLVNLHVSPALFDALPPHVRRA